MSTHGSVGEQRAASKAEKAPAKLVPPPAAATAAAGLVENDVYDGTIVNGTRHCAPFFVFLRGILRTCVPRDGATLRQLAPLPLNRPRNPSTSHAFCSSCDMVPHSSPRHIIIVLTISRGAQQVRLKWGT